MLLKTVVAGLALASSVSIRMQDQAAKPRGVPLLSESGPSGFLIEVRSTSARPITATTFGACRRFRLDGQEFEVPSAGGSGSGRSVAPGETWLELVRFIKQRDPSGRRPPNPSPRDIVGNIQIERTLSAGEHKLTVSCGGAWSAELAFYWTDRP